MPFGAAIGGAAVIGGGASIISGNKAANAQRDAAQQSADIQRYMFDQSRADQTPYREVGTGALRKLAGMYGVGAGSGGTDWNAYVEADPLAKRDWQLYHSGGQAVPDGKGGWITPDNMSMADYGQYHWKNDGGKRDLAPFQAGASGGGVADYGGFETSPGYQFRRDEGMKAIERSAASRGLLGSGATMKAVGRFADGLASSEYENYANALRSMAGIGQTSTQQTGAQGIATGQGIAQSMTNAGNARASSFANTGAAINNGVSNVLGAYLQGGFGGRAPSPYGGNLGGIY